MQIFKCRSMKIVCISSMKVLYYDNFSWWMFHWCSLLLQGAQLRKHIDATLGSGNLREAVRLPTGEDLNEWLAVNSELYILPTLCSLSFSSFFHVDKPFFMNWLMVLQFLWLCIIIPSAYYVSHKRFVLFSLYLMNVVTFFIQSTQNMLFSPFLFSQDPS